MRRMAVALVVLATLAACDSRAPAGGPPAGGSSGGGPPTTAGPSATAPPPGTRNAGDYCAQVKADALGDARLRRDVPVVGTGQQRDAAAGVLHQLERLPGTDRRPVRDQWPATARLRGHEELVGVREEGHRPVAQVDHVELLPLTGGGAVG